MQSGKRGRQTAVGVVRKVTVSGIERRWVLCGDRDLGVVGEC